jgi:acetyl esterase/lipase
VKRFVRSFAIVTCACLGVMAVASPAAPWRPPAGTIEIPLWPANAKIARPAVTGPETASVGKRLFGGRPVTGIDNVTRPTMVIYRARGRNTGAAVLVFPGGGYRGLAIDLEGTDVCDWLVPKGVTCAVLKYRVPWSGPHWDEGCKCQAVPKVPMARQDAQRAMALLRQRSRQFGIDPNKIGVIGFSAGGHLVADVSNADTLSYTPVDAADRQDVRPNFGIALYPGHLWADRGVELARWNHISAKAPPTLIVAAEDDPVDDVHNSITYFLALREAKRPVEMHLYAHGGHAFGLRPTNEPITHWPVLAEKWLHTIGILRN